MANESWKSGHQFLWCQALWVLLARHWRQGWGERQGGCSQRTVLLSPCRAPGDEEVQAENLITSNGEEPPFQALLGKELLPLAFSRSPACPRLAAACSHGSRLSVSCSRSSSCTPSGQWGVLGGPRKGFSFPSTARLPEAKGQCCCSGSACNPQITVESQLPPTDSTAASRRRVQGLLGRGGWGDAATQAPRKGFSSTPVLSCSGRSTEGRELSSSDQVNLWEGVRRKVCKALGGPRGVSPALLLRLMT